MWKVIRRTLAVVGLAVFAFAGYVVYVNQPLPQNEHDVPIVKRTMQLLADERDWSKHDDRTCGPEKDGLSLYCALRQASVDVTGEFRHRAAALQAVRYAIEEATPDREYAHRLMGYNNDRATSFADMHDVLQSALLELQEKRTEAD